MGIEETAVGEPTNDRPHGRLPGHNIRNQRGYQSQQNPHRRRHTSPGGVVVKISDMSNQEKSVIIAKLCGWIRPSC
jgi:hypothetical protein